ncbi:MAG: hypothetical protein HYT87_11815 [Nitrospirae bacterium]|nr:hypothetical protein [Nitrospirota bacterium]
MNRRAHLTCFLVVLAWVVGSVISLLRVRDFPTARRIGLGSDIGCVEEINAIMAYCADQNPRLLTNPQRRPWMPLVWLATHAGSALGLDPVTSGRMFSVLCGAAVLIMIVFFSKEAGGRPHPAPVLLLALHPWFSVAHWTALPEPFFALVLFGALWSGLLGHGKAAAALFGCLPLVKFEGAFAAGAWFLIMVHRKEWRSMMWIVLPVFLSLAVDAIVFGNPFHAVAYYAKRHALFPARAARRFDLAVVADIFRVIGPLWIVGGLLGWWVKSRWYFGTYFVLIATVIGTVVLMTVFGEGFEIRFLLFLLPWLILWSWQVFDRLAENRVSSHFRKYGVVILLLALGVQSWPILRRGFPASLFPNPKVRYGSDYEELERRFQAHLARERPDFVAMDITEPDFVFQSRSPCIWFAPRWSWAYVGERVGGPPPFFFGDSLAPSRRPPQGYGILVTPSAGDSLVGAARLEYLFSSRDGGLRVYRCSPY